MSSAEQTPNLEMNSEFRTCAAKAILQRVSSVLLRCPRRWVIQTRAQGAARSPGVYGAEIRDREECGWTTMNN